MKGCDHRNLSAVLKRRSESTLLLARRISLLIFTKRVTGSPEPFGSSSPITFCMNWSLTCKSCTVYFGCSFFGNWNTIGLVTSVPVPVEAETSGTVPEGIFQEKAKIEKKPGLPSGMGQAR